MATAIEFNHVSKLYRLGLVSTGTFREDIKRWWITSVQKKEDPYLTIGETNDRGTKGESNFVWALRDIDFKVEQGDVVGIIGKNGAGKSTLLKLLSRITSPTTGDIRAKGRIASLLEVGTGFHPEMTGRENIYLNGAILGMTKEEIARKLDEIVDFSGCERYIDTPVKRYSSGMRVRLGFAVAAHLDPDILVVDEVLAVGDAEFQKKAIGKMQTISKGEGRTVLFVSHNMDSVRSLCRSGVVLKNGTVEFMGTATDSIDFYLEANTEHEDIAIPELTREPGVTGQARITDLQYLNPTDDTPTYPYTGRALKIRIHYEIENLIESFASNCYISIGVNDDRNMSLMSFASYLKYSNFNMHKGSHYADLIIPHLPLTAGKYKLSVLINVNKYAGDFIRSKIPMEVLDDDFFHVGGHSMPTHVSGHIVLAEHCWCIDGKELEY